MSEAVWPGNAEFSCAGSCNQQAAVCFSSTRNAGGASVEQIGMAYGQRGWNRQPDGGCTREGGAPAAPSHALRSASGSGAALKSSFVYGCAGEFVMLSAGPTSTTLPAYITMIVSARYLAEAMS